jgi:arylsulfatase
MGNCARKCLSGWFDMCISFHTMPHSVAMLFTTYTGMDMGRDNGGVVDLDYED